MKEIVLPNIIYFKIIDYLVCESVEKNKNKGFDKDGRYDDGDEDDHNVDNDIHIEYAKWITELRTVSKIFNSIISNSYNSNFYYIANLDNTDLLNLINEYKPTATPNKNNSEIECYNSVTRLFAEEEFLCNVNSGESFNAIFNSLEKLSIHEVDLDHCCNLNFGNDDEDEEDDGEDEDNDDGEENNKGGRNKSKTFTIPALKSLELREVALSADVYKSIEKLVPTCPTTNTVQLTHLSIDIFEGFYEVDEMVAFFEYVFSKKFANSLKSFELSKIDTESLSNPEVLNSLFSGLLRLKSLQHLKLHTSYNQHQQTKEIILQQLSAYLKQQQTLTSIELHNFYSTSTTRQANILINTLFKDSAADNQSKIHNINDITIINSDTIPPVIDREVNKLHIGTISSDMIVYIDRKAFILPKSVRSLQVGTVLSFKQLAEFLSDNHYTRELKCTISVNPAENRIVCIDAFLQSLRENDTLQRIEIYFTRELENGHEFEAYEIVYRDTLIKRINDVIKVHPTILNKDNWFRYEHFGFLNINRGNDLIKELPQFSQ